MRGKTLVALAALLLSPSAWADDGLKLPRNASFSTFVTTPLVIEGLTGDRFGNLYSTGRTPGAGLPCPVWRVSLDDPARALVTVGFVLPASATGQCAPTGIAFDAHGDLFIADGDRIVMLTPNAATPAVATTYVNGVPGTNGLAFDRTGNLWTTDGIANQGRVWRIPPGGGAAVEVFRIPPMANSLGVGREIRPLPPGTPNGLVANGIVFDRQGDILVADTARGAIWKVELDRNGNVRSRTGCDTTFTGNTLCLENVLVAHPLLEGADGIALDVAGNIWVSVNERNAIVVVSPRGAVAELFQNPANTATDLRNEGPLEFPTSPFLSGERFCTANADFIRRDNAPNTAGEIAPGTARQGKIACLDQRLRIPGARQ